MNKLKEAREYWHSGNPSIVTLITILKNLGYRPKLRYDKEWAFFLCGVLGYYTNSLGFYTTVGDALDAEIDRLENGFKGKSFEEIFKNLSDLGHNPGVYKRGDKWRAYLDCGSNNWKEADTPKEAILKVVKNEIV